jgi:hypothetical protein
MIKFDLLLRRIHSNVKIVDGFKIALFIVVRKKTEKSFSEQRGFLYSIRV